MDWLTDSVVTQVISGAGTAVLAYLGIKLRRFFLFIPTLILHTDYAIPILDAFRYFLKAIKDKKFTKEEVKTFKAKLFIIVDKVEIAFGKMQGNYEEDK